MHSDPPAAPAPTLAQRTPAPGRWQRTVTVCAVVALGTAAGAIDIRPVPPARGRDLPPLAEQQVGADSQVGLGPAATSPDVYPAASRPVPSAASPRPSSTPTACRVGRLLVPTCGVLWGVAPGALTEDRGATALAAFEQASGRTQDIYHAYHRGQAELFPTAAERAIARQPGKNRLLFLNWKPTGASWAQIAAGARDGYLDRLAVHIRATYPDQFFFTVHHEPENDVRQRAGSGYTATDYAAMFRHVITRLRAHGATNLVTVIVHMAYPKLTSSWWFRDLYPGDDVVDWVGFDTYARSQPGYGYGDFNELINRRSLAYGWPGFYTWATAEHPDKPLMVSEWGLWRTSGDPHAAALFGSVVRQLANFPRIKAMVYFDTPSDQRGRDSRIDRVPSTLAAFRQLARHPLFDVELPG